MFGKLTKHKRLKKRPETKRSRMFHDAFRSEREIRVRKRPEEGRKRSLPWWAWSLWTIFLGAIVYTIFFSPFHTLEYLSVSGNRDVPTTRIEGFIQQEWSRPSLFVLPGNNFFLFRVEDMEKRLLERFPKLETAEVRKIFPSRVRVMVAERDRIFLYCSGGRYFLVDREGRARDIPEAIRKENDPFFVRIEDTTGATIEPGTLLFEPEFPDVALRLERGLREESGLSFISPITMPSRVSRELRFRVEAGWEVYASADVLPEKTAATLRLVLEDELPEERREKLRYIDLRTENRAFYAFEEEDQEEERSEGDESEEQNEGSDDEGEEEPEEYDSDEE